MKRLSIIILLICGLLFQTVAFANEFSVFPEENLVDLTLIATDPESGSFTIMNKAEEVINGFAGDLIGADGHIVFEVSERYITVEIVEIIDWNGEEFERPILRMKLPLAYTIEGPKGVSKGVQ